MELLVAFILNYCGYEENWKCYDHFNNCMVGKAGEIQQKDIDKCIKEYENEEQKSK